MYRYNYKFIALQLCCVTLESRSKFPKKKQRKIYQMNHRPKMWQDNASIELCYWQANVFGVSNTLLLLVIEYYNNTTIITHWISINFLKFNWKIQGSICYVQREHNIQTQSAMAINKIYIKQKTKRQKRNTNDTNKINTVGVSISSFVENSWTQEK